MLDFKSYFRGLSKQERQEFAKRAGRSEKYINERLVYGTTSTTISTIIDLATAGDLPPEDLAVWFVNQAVSKA